MGEYGAIRMLEVAQDQETQAFTAACMEHLSGILRYIRAATRWHHDAEDLAQDVFVQALANRQQAAGPELRPWLYQIARNKVAEFYRRQAVRRRGEEKLKGYAMNAETDTNAAVLPDSRAAAL